MSKSNRIRNINGAMPQNTRVVDNTAIAAERIALSVNSHTDRQVVSAVSKISKLNLNELIRNLDLKNIRLVDLILGRIASLIDEEFSSINLSDISQMKAELLSKVSTISALQMTKSDKAELVGALKDYFDKKQNLKKLEILLQDISIKQQKIIQLIATSSGSTTTINNVTNNNSIANVNTALNKLQLAFVGVPNKINAMYKNLLLMLNSFNLMFNNVNMTYAIVEKIDTMAWAERLKPYINPLINSIHTNIKKFLGFKVKDEVTEPYLSDNFTRIDEHIEYSAKQIIYIIHSTLANLGKGNPYKPEYVPFFPGARLRAPDELESLIVSVKAAIARIFNGEDFDTVKNNLLDHRSDEQKKSDTAAVIATKQRLDSINKYLETATLSNVLLAREAKQSDEYSKYLSIKVNENINETLSILNDKIDRIVILSESFVNNVNDKINKAEANTDVMAKVVIGVKKAFNTGATNAVKKDRSIWENIVNFFKGMANIMDWVANDGNGMWEHFNIPDAPNIIRKLSILLDGIQTDGKNVSLTNIISLLLSNDDFVKALAGSFNVDLHISNIIEKSFSVKDSEGKTVSDKIVEQMFSANPNQSPEDKAKIDAFKNNIFNVILGKIETVNIDNIITHTIDKIFDPTVIVRGANNLPIPLIQHILDIIVSNINDSFKPGDGSKPQSKFSIQIGEILRSKLASSTFDFGAAIGESIFTSRHVIDGNGTTFADELFYKMIKHPELLDNVITKISDTIKNIDLKKLDEVVTRFIDKLFIENDELATLPMKETWATAGRQVFIWANVLKYITKEYNLEEIGKSLSKDNRNNINIVNVVGKTGSILDVFSASLLFGLAKAISNALTNDKLSNSILNAIIQFIDKMSVKYINGLVNGNASGNAFDNEFFTEKKYLAVDKTLKIVKPGTDGAISILDFIGISTLRIIEIAVDTVSSIGKGILDIKSNLMEHFVKNITAGLFKGLNEVTFQTNDKNYLKFNGKTFSETVLIVITDNLIKLFDGENSISNKMESKIIQHISKLSFTEYSFIQKDSEDKVTAAQYIIDKVLNHNNGSILDNLEKSLIEKINTSTFDLTAASDPNDKRSFLEKYIGKDLLDSNLVYNFGMAIADAIAGGIKDALDRADTTEVLKFVGKEAISLSLDLAKSGVKAGIRKVGNWISGSSDDNAPTPKVEVNPAPLANVDFSSVTNGIKDIKEEIKKILGEKDNGISLKTIYDKIADSKNILSKIDKKTENIKFDKDNNVQVVILNKEDKQSSKSESTDIK